MKLWSFKKNHNLINYILPLFLNPPTPSYLPYPSLPNTTNKTNKTSKTDETNKTNKTKEQAKAELCQAQFKFF